ncbi:MAG: exodeoxyribonuclease VII small subunit [Clostridiales bacterium]|nr:exodeoxyribonuclease VII small subunit [Clostridiales bacterium]
MKRKKFEDSILRLEEIINQLENKELTLDNSLKLFQEGVELYKHCNQKLESAEAKITIILEENSISHEVPFEERTNYGV